ncbi:antibiotic biosynthesis monooxygenase [Lentibacillus sp. N15]|uniref:antibiotic biosynthesis monooxygenase family protein n=1 Tax=Lentibacillus songyuanensis TaxID=3136161 RepID=UPI0031BAE949
MHAYMTKGTYDFLQKLEDKYPDISFYFMAGSSGTLAYYEGKGKNVFVAGSAFDIAESSGAIEKEGYTVMNHIPVVDDKTEIVEERFKQRKSGLANMPGFQAFRLLRPRKGNTYVVVTQWASEDDFKNWKQSSTFKKQHQNQAAKPPAYVAAKPFITTYQMIKPE